MASSFLGINIGTSGLFTYQAALNTTSHNISNVETNGFTRQEISQTAGVPISTNKKNGMIGTGVTATTVTQIRNEYYDMKYRNNNTTLGFYSVKDEYMLQIENYFNELNTEGFTTTMGNFSSALQELSKDNTSKPVRTQVAQYGASMAEHISEVASKLEALQKDANFEVKNCVDRINAIAEQIATLTKQINAIEKHGTIANDLRDSRNLLVDELSSLAKVEVVEVPASATAETSYTVRIGQDILVDSITTNKLELVSKKYESNLNDAVGLYDIQWSTGEPLYTKGNAIGGKLQALLDIRDGNNGTNFTGKVSEQAADGKSIKITGANITSEINLNIPVEGKIKIGNFEYEYTSFRMDKDPTTGEVSYTFNLKEELKESVVDQKIQVGEAVNYKGIPYYMNKLNEFVRTFAKEFNAVHNQGQYKDADGNTVQGGDFFSSNGMSGEFNESDPFNFESSYYYMTAKGFQVSSDILEDPSKIVTSSNLSDGIENSDILTDLIDVLSDKTMFKEGAPLSFLQSFIADIAIDTKKAGDFATNQEGILKTISNQRLSISGVDIDEETMNLVRYQNGYNLSAKIIQVMDEILNQLINGMGV